MLKKLIILTSFLFVIPVYALAAGGIKDYSNDALMAAEKYGDAVVLDFHASWCPLCKKQAEVLEKLSAEGVLKRVTVLRVDFDSASELKDKYGVTKQSTLILLKDGKEVSRSMGETDPEKIREFLAQTGM